jgi:arginyl-tRNA synthetase
LQFGMLIHGYKNFRDDAALQANPVPEMLRLYLKVRELIKPAEDVEEDPSKAGNYPDHALAESRNALAACRQETARLHEGDPGNVALWKRFTPWCMEEIEHIYRRLDVQFEATHGESFYNPRLPGVVADLLERKIAWPSKGAVAIFFDETGEVAAPPPESDPEDGKQNRIPPALIQSSHAAYTYTTTDLATIQHRMETWQPDAILYVVDSRQALHFKNLFAIARRWGYVRTELAHISFGSVLDKKTRKPIKTREGGGVSLDELLDEAVRRAEQVYQQTRQDRLARGEEVPDLSLDELKGLYPAVGYGAVKYADLSQNRESDYVFDWDKMLATDGNTATYMQYAYARCRAIFRKGDEDAGQYRQHPPQVYLEQPQERALALQLLRLEESLHAAAADYRPNLITGYLWDLASAYSKFYDRCRVLNADTPALRHSRLLLCDLTARTIQKGLDLLGIRTIERM